MTGLSCIIPTHGRPALLERAVRSVMSQSRQPRELIVVDDLGEAATRAVVERLAPDAGFPILYVTNADQPGACGSRNIGAGLAKGALLAFLDDDDHWHPCFLKRCAPSVEQGGNAFATALVTRLYPSGEGRVMPTVPGLTRDTVLRHRSCMTGSSFVIRKDVFEAVGGFDRTVSVFNDWDLFVRLVSAGHAYAVVEQPLAYWVEHHEARITTASLARADGIDAFLRRYRSRMAPDLFVSFLRMSTGIRRAQGRGRLALASAAWHAVRTSGFRKLPACLSFASRRLLARQP